MDRLIYLLIGTDFSDAFIDVLIKPGEQQKPNVKRNCFGWYILGMISNENDDSKIVLVDVSTVNAKESIKKLLIQDQLREKPTKHCTCTDDILRENKFIKSFANQQR